MELTTAVRRRRMVRRFEPDRDVGLELVARLIDLATHAPSAGFSQGWDFVVLLGHNRDRFWSATTGGGDSDPWLDGVRAAPALVVCLSDPVTYLNRYAEPDKGWTDRSLAHWPIPYWDTDTAMAAMIMLLGAVDEGLGALFFGVPADRVAAVAQALHLPPEHRIVGVVALGYEAERVRSRSLGRGRRPLGEVLHVGRFGVPGVAG